MLQNSYKNHSPLSMAFIPKSMLFLDVRINTFFLRINTFLGPESPLERRTSTFETPCIFERQVHREREKDARRDSESHALGKGRRNETRSLHDAGRRRQIAGKEGGDSRSSLGFPRRDARETWN